MTEDPGRLARRLDVEVGQERVGDGAVTGVGVAARNVDVAPGGAAISSARRLASPMPHAGRSRRGGFREGGFPPAVEDREHPFERPRAGRVHALGGRLGRQDQQRASLARGLPCRRGRARAGVPRSGRALGTEGSNSPTAMFVSSRPCGSSR